MSGEQWATLESLNPSCFPSRSIARRGSERTLERFTIGRSKASQVQKHACVLSVRNESRDSFRARGGARRIRADTTRVGRWAYGDGVC